MSSGLDSDIMKMADKLAEQAEMIRQLADQRAELLDLAKDSLDWHRGDKWRDSEIPSQREAWERRRDWIEQCIARCATATQQRNATGGEG